VQLDEMGEHVLEVGARSGWGPAGLSAEQLETALRRLGEGAEQQGADMTVLRRRQLGGEGEGEGEGEGVAADVLLRRRPRTKPPLEVRAAAALADTSCPCCCRPGVLLGSRCCQSGAPS
jgi:hypothetical protein